MSGAVWIAFEGGEASGKSTQARLLASRLNAVLTREPGGTAVGERVRELLLDPSVSELDARAETLLMAADRAQHVAEVVLPALAAGRYVVSDRSAYSSLAYQGFGRGLDVDEVMAVSGWATSGVWPDLVVLLDVEDGVQLARMGRDLDRLESAGDEFHKRVLAGYRELAAAGAVAGTGAPRWVVVDGSGSIEEVSALVDDAVDAWLVSHG